GCGEEDEQIVLIHQPYEHTQDNSKIEQHDHAAHKQSEFFADHRKDIVGVRFRKPHFLGSEPKAAACPATAHQRAAGEIDLIVGGAASEKRINAMAGIVVEQVRHRKQAEP